MSRLVALFKSLNKTPRNTFIESHFNLASIKVKYIRLLFNKYIKPLVS